MNRQQKLISIRCDELRRLTDGWDGPDSKRPTEDALRSAEDLLDRIEIEPHPNGAVSIIGNGYYMLGIRPDGSVA